MDEREYSEREVREKTIRGLLVDKAQGRNPNPGFAVGYEAPTVPQILAVAARWVMALQDGARFLLEHQGKPHPHMLESELYGMKDAVPLVEEPTVRVRKRDRWDSDRCPMCHAAFIVETEKDTGVMLVKLKQIASEVGMVADDLCDRLKRAELDVAKWRHVADHAQQDLAALEEKHHREARGLPASNEQAKPEVPPRPQEE